MSRMLYFTSFSPENFQNGFLPASKESLRRFFDVDKELLEDFEINRADLKMIASHILKNGLTYKGLNDDAAEVLDTLFRYVIFSTPYGELEDAVFDLDERTESDGIDINSLERLLQHVGISYSQGDETVLESHSMLQLCIEGRRFGETDPWGEYESYVIFDNEELPKLRHEIRSILDSRNSWDMESDQADRFREHVVQNLLMPVETAIRENRLLFGHWG